MQQDRIMQQMKKIIMIHHGAAVKQATGKSGAQRSAEMILVHVEVERSIRIATGKNPSHCQLNEAMIKINN